MVSKNESGTAYPASALNLDYTFCANQDCQLRYRCFRGVDVPTHAIRVSMSYWRPINFECTGFKPRYAKQN